ncbi:metal-sensing transcriptional repressor (plasmid) [Shinella sp. PSBB067]|uniref:metal-sensing transcriptional repressor n=1 Tax=Shinella sp. PSBB067 TaxID=2715959 RepID=UPI00193BEFF0|nr:metal-sensing transcriptional repressor [Shinella sp. PSBB067]QRI66729.1 metal-sensing transcriptional repressor [Shinella sp. PSBB067]
MIDDRELHPSHPDIAKRLRRAEGHIRKVIEMIETGRPCLDIVHQLHAVEKAIIQAKRTLALDHLDHCLEAVVGPLDHEDRNAIRDFSQITRFL